jgi:hypothetical protein
MVQGSRIGAEARDAEAALRQALAWLPNSVMLNSVQHPVLRFFGG